MNKVVLFLMIAVFFTACGVGKSEKSVVSTTVINSYANGKPQIERDYSMIDGKKLGVYEREYYEDGSILKEGPLSINEKRNGLWKSYYRDGTLWSEGDYKNGVREGKTVTYFANGNKYYEGQFKKAQKSGVWKFWNKKGDSVNTIDFEKRKRAVVSIDK